jgi:hypothetical protein
MTQKWWMVTIWEEMGSGYMRAGGYVASDKMQHVEDDLFKRMSVGRYVPVKMFLKARFSGSWVLYTHMASFHDMRFQLKLMVFEELPG